VAAVDSSGTRRTLIFRWAPSLLLLALVLAYVPLRDVGQVLANAKLSWVVWGIGLLIIMRLASAYRMHIITRHQGMSLSTMDIFKIGFVTAFFGLFLPGYIAGGAIRWHMLSRKDKKGAEAIASIAFDRVNDAIVLFLLGCISLIAASPATVAPAVPWILATALLTLLLLYAVLLSPQSTRLSVMIVTMLGLYQRPWFKKKFTQLTDSMAGFQQFPGIVRLQLWGLSLLFYVMGTLVYVLMAGVLDLGLSFTDCAWQRATLHLLFLLPLSVSGIGVRETALVALLAPFGISSAQAVACSFLLMAGLLVMVDVGGLLAPGMYLKPGKAESK
jgi:glycosyltransferase 2 family protein